MRGHLTRRTMRSRSTIQALYPELADLALRSDGQLAFRSAWLSCLAPTLGIDSATVCSSRDGKSYSSYTVNADSERLQRDLASYTEEIEPQDLSLLMRSQTVLDSDFWSARRRDELRVYREYLAPHGTVGHAMRFWIRDGQMFCWFMARGRGREFDREGLRALDLLFPVIALGEALHAPKEPQSTKRSLAELGNISRAEQKVVALAQRGLTNAEIARVTGTQAVTVRNQLSSAYRKLGVTNRTELTFLLSGIDCDVRDIRGMPMSAIEKLLAEQRCSADLPDSRADHEARARPASTHKCDGVLCCRPLTTNGRPSSTASGQASSARHLPR